MSMSRADRDGVSADIARICAEMIDWEEAGAESAGHFEALLDPAFRFRRADRTVVNKSEFIAGLKGAASRGRVLDGDVEVTPLEVGAIASLRVKVGADAFRNVRVFLRESGTGKWRLQMWCNEKIAG